jgi:hypothetical protein
MTPRAYPAIDDAQQRRFEDIYTRHRRLHECPGRCRPMIIVNAPLLDQTFTSEGWAPSRPVATATKPATGRRPGNRRKT